MASQSDESTQKELFEHDWYALLECNKTSTKKAIEKSARKLSLQYHPDMTADPKKLEMFTLIQKAKVNYVYYNCVFFNILIRHESLKLSINILGYSP